MILQTVLAFCLASVVLGDGCCTPKQWEGREYIAGGWSKYFRRGGIAEAYDISYDAVSKMVAVSGKNEKASFKMILNYNVTKGYFIRPDQKKCKVFKLRQKFRESCIPDDAVLVGNSFFGAGANSLDVTAYRMQYKDKRANIFAIAVVTKEGCIPVTEDISGSYKRVNFFENVNFGGITAGIKDPTVFSPPDYCQEVEMEFIYEEFHIHSKYTMTIL